MGSRNRRHCFEGNRWIVTPSRWAVAFLFLGFIPMAHGEGIVVSTSPSFVFQWREEPVPPFAVGESIRYIIKYGLIPAGFATLEVVSTETVAGRPTYRILSEAKTNKGMDVVFKVRDTNESWIDAESLCSLQFRQDIREGRYTRRVETTYDHPGRRFLYKKWRKGNESVQEGAIPPFVHDVLSSLYYIRTRPLEVGKDFTMDANSGATTWPLSVHVRAREQIKVPAGTFDCFHLEPVLAGDGIFQASGRLEVWVTVDPPHIPVLLRSRVMVGAFDAEMTEFRPGPVPDPSVESIAPPSPEMGAR
ncbi:MAG: DUF3108 domain-containing protein [Elusimicrobia bacterium]|nr:DUF3108 domain-containing protein [Elusimicrobiota bacterium]